MSALAIVRAKLLATPAVVAITPASKIHPIMLPEATAAPAIVLNIVGGSDVQVLAGAGGYYDQRVRTECMATTATGVSDLAGKVLAALENVVKATIAGYRDVDIAFAGTENTDWADDRSLARWIRDYSVRWRA